MLRNSTSIETEHHTPELESVAEASLASVESEEDTDGKHPHVAETQPDTAETLPQDATDDDDDDDGADGLPQERVKDPELERLFETEMLPNIDALYRFAFKLTGNEDDANDLVQDTFLKAYRFISSYEKGSNAKAWLFRILKNSFINNYRKASKQPNQVDYEEAETYLNTGLSARTSSIDGRDKLFGGMIGDEVTRSLNALPVDFRTVIILCDIEEFTYEEIAKIVDIPIGTVRSRLHRARKMLREMLTEYAMELGFFPED